LTKGNPHSLAAVLNLNVEDVMVVLRLFGLVKKYGEGIRVVKKVEEWRKNNWIKKYIEDDENSIHLFKSRYSKSNEIFIKLGKDDDEKHSPAAQKHDDKPPYPSERRIFIRKCQDLKMKIDHYMNLQPSSSSPREQESPQRNVSIIDNPAVLPQVSPERPSPDSGSNLLNRNADLSGSNLLNRNADLLEKYAAMGFTAEDVAEIPLPASDVRSHYPMLAILNIPLAPVILRKLAIDLINLQKATTSCDLNIFSTIDNISGGNHQRILLPLLKPISERSFLDNCREPINNLPKDLVKQSKFKGINGREREERLAKEELDIRIWCIKALIDGDETGEAVRAVARDDLGMITKKIMPASDIGAIIQVSGITPTAFKSIKSYMQTFFEYRMFDSEKSVRELYCDALTPLTGCWTDENGLKTDYSYKELEQVILLRVNDVLKSNPSEIEATKRIHLVFSGDHGQGAMRFSCKVLLMQKDADDSRVISEQSYSIGEIDCKKDDYRTLLNTLMPKYDEMISRLNTKMLSFTLQGNETICQITDDQRIIEQAEKTMVIKTFVTGDYKFYATILGKPDRAQFYCTWCKMLWSIWKADANSTGDVWTQNGLHQTFQVGSTIPAVNQGVVSASLLKSVEVSNFLFAMLHQLLGTGNDIRKEIVTMIDMEFETWPEDLVALHLNRLDADIDLETQLRNQLNSDAIIDNRINTLQHNMTALTNNYQREPRGGANMQQVRQHFIAQKLLITDDIKALKDEKKQNDIMVKDARKVLTAAKKVLKGSITNRTYTDKPLRIMLFDIFKEYSITPEQYHGGEFVGNHCRIFMDKAKEICAEIGDILKLVPIERRRRRTTNSDVMTDEAIDEKLGTLRDLLILADSIYSTCNAPAGTLDDDAITSTREVVSIFCAMWRQSGLSVTVKVHNIEKHLVSDFLERFRGLGEYDESFMERDHQTGVKNERKSANIKTFDSKAKLHSRWERLTKNPSVMNAMKRFEEKRKKRSADDVRVVRSSERQSGKKQRRVERRENTKIERIDWLTVDINNR
jgi:hypothetical protein